MATLPASSTSFWQRLRRGPWGKPVAERIEHALDEAVRRLRTDDAVVAIMVFGSYARGDFSRKSDLDLLVVLRRSQQAERQTAEQRIIATILDVEVVARLPMHLAPLIAAVDQSADLSADLLHNLWTDGVILYGEAWALAMMQPRGLAPWNVVRFRLTGASARERSTIARRLHGTKSRPALIRPPALDLARGSAFVPAEQARAVQDALEEAGASYDLIPVWRDV